MQYEGFYINLTRSTERNKSMTTQINELGFSHLYRRFNAIEASFESNIANTPMKNGELGCWLSHVEIIKQHQGKDTHLHILEDDALLHPMLSTMPSLMEWLDNRVDWDIIYTDVYFHPPPSPEKFHQFLAACDQFRQQKKLNLISLESFSITGTTSYFINKRNIKKVYSLLNDQWKSGKTFDIFIAGLIKKKQLNAFSTAPFITSINPKISISTIADYGNNTATLDLLRRSLFIDASPEYLYQQSLELNKDQIIDPRIGLYAESIKTVLSHVK
jgi:GR25 family glycosyltransferase involved in LPS biosynthesis